MTLVEVLTAAVILGAGVAGLLSAAAMALRNQRGSEYRAAAMCLAQEKMGEVDVAGPGAWMARRATRGVVDGDGATYSWDVNADELPVGRLYDVQVTVAWAAAGSRGQVQLQTWLNDRPADKETGKQAETATADKVSG